jgi:hypothetical protein
MKEYVTTLEFDDEDELNKFLTKNAEALKSFDITRRHHGGCCRFRQKDQIKWKAEIYFKPKH